MIKVFLVEDEKIIRKSIKNNVKWEENGFEFAGEAPDGEMALPMIEKLHPDIVITDIKMTFMDGLELSDILKKKMPKIQIIILSGYGEFDYAKEAIKIGVTDYLTKPVTGEQLLVALNKVKQKLDMKKRQEEDIKKLQKNIETLEVVNFNMEYYKIIYEQLLINMPGGILISFNRKIMFANNKALELFNLKSDEKLINKSILDLVYEPER